MDYREETTVTPGGENNVKNKWKKRVGIIIFVLFNAAVILYTAINEFGGNRTAAKFSDIKLRWHFLIPAALCCIGAIAVETLKYAIVMKRTCGFVNVKLCLETVIFGRYYDSVTPSGVGGQPYQIYHMKKNGVPAAQSAAIPLAAFMSMQYGFVLLALACFIFGGVFMKSNFVRITGYFGLVMYSLLPTAILMFTFFPKFSIRAVTWGVGVLHKIRIVKDKDKTVTKVEDNLRAYVECTKTLLKSKGLVFETIILGILYQVAICSIPYFVIYSFGGTLNYFQCFCTTVSIYATITFIPTPGNMGAAEGTFYAVFSMVSAGYIFWAMLTWRFFTYYVFIAAGLMTYFLRALTSKRKKVVSDG